MCNKGVKVIRPAKKSTEQEKQQIKAWLDEMQTWAKSVGLTEQDIEDTIREVRQEKRLAQRQNS